jgi:hypothetical protein
MIIAENTPEFMKYINDLPPKTKIILLCPHCNEQFTRAKNVIQSKFGKHNNLSKIYCSKKCFSLTATKKQNVICKQCSCSFYKMLNQIKKRSNNFCSRSCAATYNNLHKTSGTRRSKLEIWIEKQLIESYLNLKIHFNKKEAINSELDIYIPSLNLAIELNGIFHYEPIYGNEKFQQIILNDQLKKEECLRQNIELIIIDSSKQKVFKELTSKIYLDTIIEIINTRISMGAECRVRSGVTSLEGSGTTTIPILPNNLL